MVFIKKFKMNTINIAFPLADDKEKNRLFELNAVSKDALTSNLLLLLLTKKGERYYLPDYGTNLEKFLFEPKDNITEDSIQEEIRETVKKYIPQLNIKGINFIGRIDEEDGSLVADNEVRVQVDFTYTEDVFSSVDRLELTLNR
jgi:phage baseplate assembly protein W